MKTGTIGRLGATLAAFTALSTGAARADWAASMGIGQKTTNLGGAVTATSDDFDAFYTNPAGAANFDRPFIGVGLKTFDTRGIKIKQTDVDPDWARAFPDADGLNLSPGKTLSGESVGVVPSAGGYMPLPGMPNVVIGIGQSVPFLVSGNFSNDAAPGNYGKFDTTDAALVIVETSPTIAVKVNDQLNLGATLGVTTFKYFKVANAIGLSFGPGTGAPLTLGSVSLETDSNVGMPVPPWEFATSPTNVSYTLGAQYKLSPSVALGVTYRSETPESFTGRADASFGALTDDVPAIVAHDHFKYDVELPRHIQAGIAVDMNSQWKVMADVRWTNWSDAKGFGSPSVIRFTDGNITPAPGALPGTTSITADYAAEDTFSIHLGTAYKLLPNLELQAGYVYDPAFMPEDRVDLITLSSNRHIFSAGGTYTKPTDDGEWAFTLGGQLALYEDRTISAGESKTAGGIIAPVQDVFDGKTDLHFQPNNQGGFDFGGYVWSVGASVSYKFGSTHTALEPGDEPLK